MSNELSAIRMFVALPISGAVKDELERVQDELRRVLPGKSARWTRRDQFHLTLKFLGNVETGRLPELINALRDACSGFPALRLRAERIGCFPDLRFPRVVWVWVHDDAEQLVLLQGRIKSAAGKIAEGETEKKFTGHVTLARLNGIKRPLAETLANRVHELTEKRFGEWTANEVKLMRSELPQSGAVYSELESFPFA